MFVRNAFALDKLERRLVLQTFRGAVAGDKCRHEILPYCQRTSQKAVPVKCHECMYPFNKTPERTLDNWNDCLGIGNSRLIGFSNIIIQYIIFAGV